MLIPSNIKSHNCPAWQGNCFNTSHCTSASSHQCASCPCVRPSLEPPSEWNGMATPVPSSPLNHQHKILLVFPHRLTSCLWSLSSCIRQNCPPHTFLVSSSCLPPSPHFLVTRICGTDIKLDSKEKKVSDRRTRSMCAVMAQCKVVDLAVLAHSDSEPSGASQPQSPLQHVELISLWITGLGLAAVPQYLAIPSVIIA